MPLLSSLGGQPATNGCDAAYREEVRGRWANLALVVLVPAAALSGVGLFLVGSGPVWLVAVLHAGLGLGPLALVPWKRPVVQRGLRRMRPGRATSLVLTWVLLAAVLSGLLHLVGLTGQWLAVTTMQLHVTAGVLAAVITLVHAVQRPVRVRRPDWGRRTLLRTGGVAVVAAGLGVGAITTGAALARAGDRRSTGSFRLDDDEVPVTQWFLDTVPTVDLQTWRLTVVSPLGERRLSLADLAGGDEVTAALDCTGGWWAEPPWSGTRLARLLPGGRPRAERRRDQQYRVCASPPVDRRPPARDVDGRFAADGGPRRSGAARRARTPRVPLGQVGRTRRGRRRSLVGPATPPAALTSRSPTAGGHATCRS